MSLYIFSNVSFILGKKEAMLPSNYQCQHLDQLDFLLFKVYVIQNKFHQILIFHHVTSYFILIKIHKKIFFGRFEYQSCPCLQKHFKFNLIY